MAGSVAFVVPPVPVASAIKTSSFFVGSSQVSKTQKRTFVASDCQIKMSQKDLNEPGDFVNFFWALSTIDEVERRAASSQVKTKQASLDAVEFSEVISMGHVFEDPIIEPMEEFVKFSYSMKHGFAVPESSSASDVYPVIDKDM